LEVIEKNPKLISQYKNGKKKLFNVLLSKIAKITDECADMPLAVKIMERLLKSRL